MLFRLNFLVVVVCLTMNTEYMLYYICPMHTGECRKEFGNSSAGIGNSKQAPPPPHTFFFSGLYSLVPLGVRDDGHQARLEHK